MTKKPDERARALITTSKPKRIVGAVPFAFSHCGVTVDAQTFRAAVGRDPVDNKEIDCWAYSPAGPVALLDAYPDRAPEPGDPPPCPCQWCVLDRAQRPHLYRAKG